MKVTIYHGPGDVRVEERPRPSLQAPEDIILQVRLTTVCGTDLHPYRGSQQKPNGFRIGHECVGVVDQAGSQAVFRPGDRVIVPALLCCGSCHNCTSGHPSQCTAPESQTVQGAQGEYIRVPLAPANLVPLPDEVSDEAALALCDSFPTGYFAAEQAGIQPGHSVAVFGAGPVGLFALLSAQLLGAFRVLVVDSEADRLEEAALLGGIPIAFTREDPVQAIRERTGGLGVDASLEAVGVDARDPSGRSAPWQSLAWACEATKPCGTVSVVGVFPQPLARMPLSTLFYRNQTLRAGLADHRRLIPPLLELVRSGRVDPTFVFDVAFDLDAIPEVYRRYARHGFLKPLVWTPAERAVRSVRLEVLEAPSNPAEP